MNRRSARAGLIAAALLATLVAIPATAGAAPWSHAGEMSQPRYGAVAASLPNGRVIVAGGRPDNNGPPSPSTELFDPGTGTWSMGASMATGREHATASRLPDGRVLVVGGRTSPFDLLASAEVFDPATGEWSPGGTLNTPRAFHAAVVLADGRVLVVGNEGPDDPAAGAEIWDPETNAWTPTGPVRRVRADAAAALLPGGRVLVTGGWSGEYERTAEIYDPATDEWTDAAPMAEPRADIDAAVLPDGRVLVAGGYRWVGHPDASRTSEIFDPATGTWTPAGPLTTPRGESPTMVTLPDGRPVIVGGFWWRTIVLAPPEEGGNWWTDASYEATAEVFDPASGTWRQTAAMTLGRAGHVSAALPDGTVLVAGGFGAGVLAERLDPDATAPPPPTDPGRRQRPPAPPPRVIPPWSKLKFAAPYPKRLVVDRAGRLRVTVQCVGTADCSDRLVVASARRGARRVLARLTVSVPKGATKRLRIPLSPRARRKAARHSVRLGFDQSSHRITRPITLRTRGGRAGVKRP